MVEPPPGVAPNDSGIWVKHFREKTTKKDNKKTKLWTLEDKPFFLLLPDIVRKLDPPDISPMGQRILYSFSDLPPSL